MNNRRRLLGGNRGGAITPIDPVSLASIRVNLTIIDSDTGYSTTSAGYLWNEDFGNNDPYHPHIYGIFQEDLNQTTEHTFYSSDGFSYEPLSSVLPIIDERGFDFYIKCETYDLLDNDWRIDFHATPIVFNGMKIPEYEVKYPDSGGRLYIYYNDNTQYAVSDSNFKISGYLTWLVEGLSLVLNFAHT